MLYWHWLHRPQHPLLRLLSAVIGLVVLAWLFVFGFLALAALAVVGTIVYFVRAVSRPHAPTAPTPTAPDNAQVIEGEFQVIRQGSSNQAPR